MTGVTGMSGMSRMSGTAKKANMSWSRSCERRADPIRYEGICKVLFASYDNAMVIQAPLSLNSAVAQCFLRCFRPRIRRCHVLNALKSLHICKI